MDTRIVTDADACPEAYDTERKEALCPMKRFLIYISVLVMMISLIAGGTLSYYTTSVEAVNVITTGNVSLVLHETTDNGAEFPEAGVVVMPGDTVSKIVTAENTGSTALYLRIELIKDVNDDALSAENCLSMNINTTDWTYRDGYYYYNTALEPGDVTSALFTEVYVDGRAVNNDFLGKKLTLDVMAYAVQSRYNGDSVWEATGWPGV